MWSVSKLVALLSLALSTSAELVFHEARASVPSGFVSKGATPVDQTIELRIGLTSNDIDGLHDKVMSISTPGSADFRQWLSAGKSFYNNPSRLATNPCLFSDEVKSFMSPSASTLSAFNAFVKANNLQTADVSPNGEWVSLTTTVGQANALFGAKFETFTHAEMSEPIVRTLSVSLPSELVGHVDVVHPTTSFEDPNVRLSPITATVDKRAIPAACNSTITPTCLQDIYGIPAAPATEKSNTLLVTAYVQEFAQTADPKVSNFFY